VRYRLGLDLGANSLGWCVMRLNDEGNPDRIVRLGVRIFSDSRNPKDGTSLATARRLARQMRRRRDRYLRRRTALLNALVRHGLMPEDRDQRLDLRRLDPYELRARALSEALPPHQFGRALFHLNQRRGFISNRRTDRRTDDNEKGAIKASIRSTRTALETSGSHTLGEWLWQRRQAGQDVRARRFGPGARDPYEFYADRALVEQEFEALWEGQMRLSPGALSTEARVAIHRIIFHQRPLRPVDPGRCALDSTDPRAPLALPSAQRFRLLQELNHLRLQLPDASERALSLQERDVLLERLRRQKTMTFQAMREAIGVPRGARFSLESEKRTALKGDETAALLRKDDCFGKRWDSLALADQDAIVEQLLGDEPESATLQWLAERFSLTEKQSTAALELPLPDGYLRIGRHALARLVPILTNAVIDYSPALLLAGFTDHFALPDGSLPHLPYYGKALQRHVAFGTGKDEDPEEKRYGRVSNPTVHVGLNQVRKVVNALIDRFGKPEQVVIEVTRELKNSRERRIELERDQTKRQKENQRYDETLHQLGLRPSAEFRQRLRLWEELSDNPLERRCIYTGEPLSITRVLSPEVEIDHILPFSISLDDGASNKTLCLARANRFKGNRAPFEAFGDSPAGYDWDEIASRAAALPMSKRRRFSKDARERLSIDGDFLARHLNDTAYLSRVAREYLCLVCPQVWAVSGRLTALLRRQWGLNSLLSDSGAKDRTDQRHHTVDAAVVCVTDRSLLQRVSRASEQANLDGVQRLVDQMPRPWERFRGEMAFGLKRVVVSYKPDHSAGGALHNDTAYGIVRPPSHTGDAPLYAHRVPIVAIGPKDMVASPALSALIDKEIGSATGKERLSRLGSLSASTKVRRARIHESLSAIHINDAAGKPFKAFKGDSNYCVEIYVDGKGKWRDLVISTFDANQRTRHQQNRHLAANGHPLVMRLTQNDSVAIGENEERRIFRVVKFSPGNIVLAEHFEGGSLKKRDQDPKDVFKYKYASASALMREGARRVFVDPIGRVLDPGNRSCLDVSSISTNAGAS
jgi:CRISPR-associated endonuclease Csn1